VWCSDGDGRSPGQDFLGITKEGQNNRLTGIDVAPEDVARAMVQRVSSRAT
jgi:hypothetical protein